MQPLEGSEQLFRVLHFEAGAIVTDKEGRFASRLPFAKLDSRRSMLPGKLPRITEQILYQHSQQSGIAMGNKSRLDLKCDYALRSARPQLTRHCVRQRT
jgi:hypothetical protein